MKKMVFRCPVDDERAKIRAMKVIAGVEGVYSVSADTREGKITVLGDADPVYLVRKLRKVGFRAELVSVGPAKEEKKTLAGEEACMYISYGEDAIKMRKMVIKCAFEDEKTKRKAMRTLSQVGVESVSVDMKEMKITVIGEADPAFLVVKLSKLGFAELLSVVPVLGKKVSKDQKRDHYSGVQQVVLKSTMEDERSKRRAMITVAAAGGADSIGVDVKEGKITVIGEVNPENLVLQLRELGFRTELLSLGPAKYEKEAGKVSAIEEQGRNHYLGVQNMRLNWASEDEGSKKRIMVAVAGFGDFDSIAVDVKQGMVIVVGNVVPVSVAMKVREFGYRAKLVSVGVGSFHKQQYEPQYTLLTRVINVIYVMHIIYIFYAGKH